MKRASTLLLCILLLGGCETVGTAVGVVIIGAVLTEVVEKPVNSAYSWFKALFEPEEPYEEDYKRQREEERKRLADNREWEA